MSANRKSLYQSTRQIPTGEKVSNVSDSYDSDDADIDLISSDDVIFKVHSYRLQYASPVFRSMIALASSASQRDPIILTDPTVESSQIVEKVLDIIYTLEIGDIPIDQEANRFRYVIEFAKKWEMTMITSVIRKEMSRSINSKLDTPRIFDNFLIALSLGDNELAASYFGSKHREVWSRPGKKRGTEPVENNQDGVPDGDSVLESEEEWRDGTDESSAVGNSDGESDNKELGQGLDRAVKDEVQESVDQYLSEQPAIGLAKDSDMTAIFGGDVFDLSTTPYTQFLHIPPTVVWIILRAQRLEKHEQGTMERCLRELLDVAYPPIAPEE